VLPAPSIDTEFAALVLCDAEITPPFDRAERQPAPIEVVTGSVFVKLVVRRFHAASLISGALNSFSGFSQTGPAGCQFRVFPD
ncbi:hypothetical protein BV911_19255, partial [Pseudoruegeria sp. SK021]